MLLDQYQIQFIKSYSSIYEYNIARYLKKLIPDALKHNFSIFSQIDAPGSDINKLYKTRRHSSFWHIDSLKTNGTSYWTCFR